MRHDDEIAFYAALKAASPQTPPCQPGIAMVEEAMKRLNIAPKRAYGLLEKWTIKGWWNYGVTARSGWFEPNSPEQLVTLDNQNES